MNFKNKIVVITGAGSGIGAACAYLFASKGATIVLADIDMIGLKETEKRLEKYSNLSQIVKTDVTIYSQVEALIEKSISDFGRVDVMVNSAGIMNTERVKTADHTFEDWDRVIRVNQTGTFYCMRAVLKKMILQGHGNIVNLASLAGIKASGNNLAYAASKYAVVGMTKSAALEYAFKNIRINAVCPSYTETPMLDKAIESQEGFDKKLLHYVPMKRFGTAEEVAQAVIWLASENTLYITGQTITLDGGLSL